MTVTRADAWQLLNEYTKNESLLKHELAVEAAVGGYARRFGEDEEGWGIAALLHDFDYERWPNASDHLPVFDRKSQQRSPTRMTGLVFFYGTLMSGFHRTGRSRLDRMLKPVGRGWVQAALYDLGVYPAAIPAQDGLVWGKFIR